MAVSTEQRAADRVPLKRPGARWSAPLASSTRSLCTASPGGQSVTEGLRVRYRYLVVEGYLERSWHADAVAA